MQNREAHRGPINRFRDGRATPAIAHDLHATRIPEAGPCESLAAFEKPVGPNHESEYIATANRVGGQRWTPHKTEFDLA